MANTILSKAFGTFLKGGYPGRRTVITPASLSQNAGKKYKHVRIPLGTGAVATQTVLVGLFAVPGTITRIKYVGQSAITGTSMTCECFLRTAAGAAGNTLQSAATDIKTAFDTAAHAKAGIVAALTATVANLIAAADQPIECVITCNTVNPGPGDLLIQVEYVPSEDSKESDNSYKSVGNLQG